MAHTSVFSLDFAAATDVGCLRGNNEDSFGYDAERQFYVVCDGMGGSAAGEVASDMAVRAVIETFEALSPDKAGEAEVTPVETRLMHAVHAANRYVREAAEADPQLQGMGSTLVCACLDGSRAVIGNVGDSRAYLIRNKTCVQVTQDHSLLDEQIRMGLLTAAEAAASNLQSVITRAIGAANTVEPDFFTVPLNLEDMLLLASDGLTRYAQAEEIAALAVPGRELTAICNELVEHAKQRGGADNITCLVLRAVEPADS